VGPAVGQARGGEVVRDAVGDEVAGVHQRVPEAEHRAVPRGGLRRPRREKRQQRRKNRAGPPRPRRRSVVPRHGRAWETKPGPRNWRAERAGHEKNSEWLGGHGVVDWAAAGATRGARLVRLLLFVGHHVVAG